MRLELGPRRAREALGTGPGTGAQIEVDARQDEAWHGQDRDREQVTDEEVKKDHGPATGSGQQQLGQGGREETQQGERYKGEGDTNGVGSHQLDAAREGGPAASFLEKHGVRDEDEKHAEDEARQDEEHLARGHQQGGGEQGNQEELAAREQDGPDVAKPRQSGATLLIGSGNGQGSACKGERQPEQY